MIGDGTGMRPGCPADNLGWNDGLEPGEMIKQEDMPLLQAFIVGMNLEIQPETAP